VVVITITGPGDLVLRRIVQFCDLNTGVASVLLGPLVLIVCCCHWAMKSSHLVESREGGLRVIQGRRLGCRVCKMVAPRDFHTHGRLAVCLNLISDGDHPRQAEERLDTALVEECMHRAVKFIATVGVAFTVLGRTRVVANRREGQTSWLHRAGDDLYVVFRLDVMVVISVPVREGYHF
jgi:hypothetical protein